MVFQFSKKKKALVSVSLDRKINYWQLLLSLVTVTIHSTVTRPMTMMRYINSEWKITEWVVVFSANHFIHSFRCEISNFSFKIDKRNSSFGFFACRREHQTLYFYIFCLHCVTRRHRSLLLLLTTRIRVEKETRIRAKSQDMFRRKKVSWGISWIECFFDFFLFHFIFIFPLLFLSVFRESRYFSIALSPALFFSCVFCVLWEHLNIISPLNSTLRKSFSFKHTRNSKNDKKILKDRWNARTDFHHCFACDEMKRVFQFISSYLRYRIKMRRRM